MYCPTCTTGDGGLESGLGQPLRATLPVPALAQRLPTLPPLLDPWPPPAGQGRRKLGGTGGGTLDRDGRSIVRRGLVALWQPVATLPLLAMDPFPRHAFGPP